MTHWPETGDDTRPNFGWSLIAEFTVKPLVIEPGYPHAGGQFEILEALPRAAVGGKRSGVPVEFCLVDPHNRFGHCIKRERTPTSRKDVDVLAQKVQRKGKNTMGLFCRRKRIQ